jgi:hypothetical protein
VLESLRTRRGSEELKVITANVGNPRGLPETELFRIDQDPVEQVNLAEQQPEVLAITLERLANQGAEAGAAAVARRQVETDAAAQERLRALGYAGGESE